MTKTRRNYTLRRPQSNKRATPTTNNPTPPKNNHEALPDSLYSGAISTGATVSDGCPSVVVSEGAVASEEVGAEEGDIPPEDTSDGVPVADVSSADDVGPGVAVTVVSAADGVPVSV